ncbi:glycosyltransferase family 4 protein [Rubrolithibacter danxiaensis]|uniref:glycosyltransferase family 4 protein n=1 Tax=Rubrolithibacter danxiaensis TaxID=3390805 RepID=UPI003BF7DEB5
MKKNKKKIIISCSTPGSLINFRGKLIEELVKNNQVYVFTPKITEERHRVALNNLGVIIYENDLLRNSISILGDIQYILQLYSIIKKIKPDIFFSYTFKPIIFGSLLASYCKVKGIIAMLTGLGYNFTEDGKSSAAGKITQRLLRFSLRSSSRLKIIFQNEDDYKELIDAKIIDVNSNTYIVNGSGVDLSHYENSMPDTNSIGFVMMSRLINAKGVREYYEAAKAIKAKYPNVKFTLLGGYHPTGVDCISEDLYRKIQSDGILDYKGWVTDVRPFIKNASAVVLPSYYREGVPRSLLEGLAMGRAIITTDWVGCKETVNVVQNERTGFLTPVKDVQALVSKLEFLIRNPEEIIRFGKNGRKYAEEKFDVNKVNKHMLEILNAS